MSYSHTYQIYNDVFDFTLNVEYIWHKAIPGTYEPGGLQIEPDEPAHPEITKIAFIGDHGNVYDMDWLPAKVINDIEDEIRREHE